ncbi:MAG: PotD/PotF family extracellular solute-binding protein [Halanaeroarchaeum sp.]
MSERSTLSRRSILKTTGLAAATSIAGCLGGGGGGESPAPNSVTEWPPQNVEGELNVWNWYDDWASWAKGAFRDANDVNVTTSGYSSPQQWYTKLQSGNTEIDNIAAQSNWAERSIENDFLHELPVDVMPSWENVTDRLKEVSAYQKDGNVYGIPEDQILYSLTYSDETFDSAPSSWGVLWDDQYEGELMMWDNSTVSCQIAALYTGQDPMQPDDYDAIEAALKQQKPLLKTYWGDYEQAMQLFVNGDVVAGPLTMGRTYMARFKENSPINYTVPKEGAMFTSDMFVIPKGAPHTMASLLFTNWATQPENAAKLFTTMGYKPAVDIGDQLSQEETEFVNWPDSWTLHFQETLADDVRQQYDDIWNAVKAA